ncbi:hypothetical protein [Devosia naphthalenivorans]|uniref:hypothetical protein n=1 Tax=Devosia naphthalenivorans TaxID=2082392 RepID=UPI000D3D486E|nr:hypothetical protein [Devosia naphthalenivorans]
MKLLTNKSSESTPEQRLKAALATDPNVATALAALQAATKRYSSIRETLQDDTIETRAVEREAETRKVLIRAQALSEIGNTTAEDVATARKEHQAASEALQGIAGRDEVLTDELRKAQAEVAERHDKLDDLLSAWKANVTEAARATAAEGVRLIQLAAFSQYDLGLTWSAPRYVSEIGEWLSNNAIQSSPEQKSPTVAASADEAVQALRRAASLKSEEVRAPRRVVSVSQPPHKIAPTYSAPGIPASLTHDPLGNPLPEAKAILERRAKEKAARSAPYPDDRAGVEEVR